VNVVLRASCVRRREERSVMRMNDMTLHLPDVDTAFGVARTRSRSIRGGIAGVGEKTLSDRVMVAGGDP
jgi:hypothetical protein